MRTKIVLAFTFIVLAWVGLGEAYAAPPLTRTRQAANMRVATGSYVGDGIDNRAISGVGFQPDVVFIKGTNNEQAVIHTATMPDDLSKEIASGSNQAGAIKTLDADGFTIGTNVRVNKARAEVLTDCVARLGWANGGDAQSHNRTLTSSYFV
jgi:hypothetical protein